MIWACENAVNVSAFITYTDSMLDVVGFDSTAPAVIADFVRS